MIAASQRVYLCFKLVIVRLVGYTKVVKIFNNANFYPLDVVCD